MPHARLRIVTTVAWVLTLCGLFITQYLSTEMPGLGWLEPVRWVLRVALVLVNWYTLIAQFWYGPLEPPLLLIMQNDRSGWYGNRYYVMLPSDYLRLDQPVPESAFIWWQIVQLFFGFMAVLLTLLLLTGHLFA